MSLYRKCRSCGGITEFRVFSIFCTECGQEYDLLSNEPRQYATKEEIRAYHQKKGLIIMHPFGKGVKP